MERREFLKKAGAVGAVIMSCQNLTVFGKDKKHKPLPKRQLGKTGEMISMIGFGGVVVMNADPEHAKNIVSEFVEKGINYFDVAPGYGDAELKMGPAIKPYRDSIFLACKTAMRDKSGAKQELDSSLKRLQTDHFDLYQLHGISDVEKDVKAAFSKDGAMQTIIEAKKAGIIKYIGFTAHSPQAAQAAMNEFDFDTIMYPINFCTHFNDCFECETLKIAKERQMGIIGIKAMAKQKWQDNDVKRQEFPKCWYDPIDDPKIAKLALSWAFSQGISSALPPGEEKLFRVAVELAPQCSELSESQLTELKNFAKSCQPLFSV